MEMIGCVKQSSGGSGNSGGGGLGGEQLPRGVHKSIVLQIFLPKTV